MQRLNSLVFANVAAVFLATVVPFSAVFAQDSSSVTDHTAHACRGAPQVIVRAMAVDDADAVCDGVERALKFLAQAGLHSPPRTVIEIVQELPPELGDRALGCYLRETRSIQLLGYDRFEADGQWFRMQRDRELYRSLASHEMAHAVVGCHSEPRKLPVPAHEYVAYVAMFATMAPSLRQSLLAKFTGSGFSSTLQINDINHLVDPNQFGVDAWRHYLSRHDREVWLRDVIAGNVVPEWPVDGP